MVASINTNLSALTVSRHLTATSVEFRKSIRRLSSGQISTADSPAAASLAQTLLAQLRGTVQAERNLQAAVNVSQTAESALGQAQDAAQRIRELGVQAANSALSEQDRAAINAEAQQLGQQIGATVSQATFNGINVLTSTGPIVVQAGANAGETANIPAQGAQIQAAVDNLNTALANFNAAPTASNAQALIVQADQTIQDFSSARAEFGAAENRFEAAIRTASNTALNTAAAQSRIQDVNVAAEATNFAKALLLQRAGIGVMAQSRAQPQMLIRLLV